MMITPDGSSGRFVLLMSSCLSMLLTLANGAEVWTSDAKALFYSQCDAANDQGETSAQISACRKPFCDCVTTRMSQSSDIIQVWNTLDTSASTAKFTAECLKSFCFTVESCLNSRSPVDDWDTWKEESKRSYCDCWVREQSALWDPKPGSLPLVEDELKIDDACLVQPQTQECTAQNWLSLSSTATDEEMTAACVCFVNKQKEYFTLSPSALTWDEAEAAKTSCIKEHASPTTSLPPPATTANSLPSSSGGTSASFDSSSQSAKSSSTATTSKTSTTTNGQDNSVMPNPTKSTAATDEPTGTKSPAGAIHPSCFIPLMNIPLLLFFLSWCM